MMITPEDANGDEYMNMFGPGQVDQMLRQAISFCWMALPKEQRTLDNVEIEVMRLVKRALRDMRDDAQSFGIDKSP